ncbi:endopygalactorunase [Chitinophaga sp. sic0106]|uniref:endopygalactorunase n=1 Tax=Chitinophaga sp. sic0106 TaxID=2854785 RepID=UPI001C4453C9|nr:endopygalactorunase [Chitinophaga sp. sic0106]MBV7529135.1 endopygalactorunase [Chitinophaga sp. sic0106]
MKNTWLIGGIICMTVVSTRLHAQEFTNIPNLVSVSGDTMYVPAGSTYAYTVDTAPGAGLVSTFKDAYVLAQQLANAYPAYSFKATNADALAVTSPNKKIKHYLLAKVPAALTGQLTVQSETGKLNQPTEILLRFKVGQRSPDATVEITLPATVHIARPDLITANIIGRGEVLLDKLATTSSGRTAAGYRFPTIGAAVVSKDKRGNTVLQFSHLDLRPDNGNDIELRITDAVIKQPGKLQVKARYRTAEPDQHWSGYAFAGITAPPFVNRSPLLKKVVFSSTDSTDNTDAINTAILKLHQQGGGMLYFAPGLYQIRTVHLQSNVHLYISKGATIAALKGGDAPETTWFSDKAYRSGTSPTDHGPYDDPENYLTKQDAGHHYFHNAMFTGERLDNIKIIGNGRITGNGNLVTSDKVMNNAPDNRSDKMFSLKLCTNIEIGGVYRKDDLWYDEQKDEPYYISGDADTDNMLHIDQAGHFVLLATGTDNIFVHDTYFGKHSPKNARDIYDFMACNNVTVTNIYSRVSSDDIVKPGSDCSLGFTRPAKHYRVRNIIGDTNCNLFQVGSETADDIKDICVDNIYVLGANKAGFSISTNDGAHISDIHLNCGHTGPLHHRSKMMRAAAPFFISISNRARILGAKAETFNYHEHGRDHKELLITNVSIGKVENIQLNGIDITEVYGGSSFSGNRWKAFDGTQRHFAAIVAGYSLPQNMGFTLPDGRATGYITNISFKDIHLTAKGGHPLTDTAQVPQELGVGQYNAADLKIQPSYGLWARHVQELVIESSVFDFEQTDHRYGIFLEDVVGATLKGLRIQHTPAQQQAIRIVNSSGTRLSNITTF